MPRQQKNSHRQERVAALINSALVEVFRRGRAMDQRLIEFPLTITRISVTSDLKIANCYFIPFNTNMGEAEIIEALNSSKYIIRNFVTEIVKLKYSPDIRFHYDCSFDNLRKVEELLKKPE